MQFSVVVFLVVILENSMLIVILFVTRTVISKTV